MQPTEQVASYPSAPQKSMGNITRILVALIAIVAIGVAVWLYMQNQGLQTQLNTAKNDTAAANAQIEVLKKELPRFATGKDATSRLKAKLSRVVVLPMDEEPTIAQVQDVTKLVGQTFFAGAENGDYILIFTKARKALVFRESNNKIINFGAITVGADNGL